MALKKLSIKNSETLSKLIEMAANHTGGTAMENARYSIDYSNGAYEPVYLRFYGRNENARFIRIILSYGFVDEDGSFHADPEIHIGFIEKYNQFFPFYVRAGEGDDVIDKRSAEFDANGKVVWENVSEIQRDVHSFTNSILNQIRKREIETSEESKDGPVDKSLFNK